MTQRKTIHDLAREAGVSVSTIDRILNGRSPVKATTVRHVLEVADRIGFYAAGTIRERLGDEIPDRTFGFLLNSKERCLYAQMADVLRHQVHHAPHIRGHAIIRHLEDLDPQIAAKELAALGEQCDAVACLCIDHPYVNHAVTDLAERGVPVVAIVSGLSSTDYSVFLGSNDWQLGRTAGWFMTHLCPGGGKVAILVGNENYRCQQVHETSFRSYIRSHAPKLEVLETGPTGETDRGAKRALEQLLEQHNDIRGILMAGGGIEGVTEVLATFTNRKPILIGTEYTDHTRELLTRGDIDVLLPHPFDEIAKQAVKTLVELTTPGAPKQRQVQHIIPFQILVSENC